MAVITWVPGAVVSPNPINLPTGSPPIDRVVAASITRIRAGLGIANHAQVDIVAALADHAVHLHDLQLEVEADAGGNRVNSALGPPVTLGRPGAGALVVGVQGTRGVQNNAAAQAHAAGAAAVTHGALTWADPVVAATPTKLDEDTITLNVNTTLGDLLTLIYEAIGARVVP
jgi:hypothetical protein